MSAVFSSNSSYKFIFENSRRSERSDDRSEFEISRRSEQSEDFREIDVSGFLSEIILARPRAIEADEYAAENGYDAYEFYDEDNNKYIYYADDDFDIFEFENNFLRSEGENKKVVDIIEIVSGDSTVVETDVDVAVVDEPLPFDYINTYRFVLESGSDDGEKIEVDLFFNQNYKPEEDEEMDGYTACEFHDQYENRYVYYICHENDIYEFGSHVLKKFDEVKQDFVEMFTVFDIIEI